MAQMVYKGVNYNTPDTPVPAPKFQSNIGASLGLAGAIPAPPSASTAAAPSTPSVPASNVPAPRTSGNAFTDLSSAFGNAINSAKTVQSAFNGGGGVNNAAFQALPANERLTAFKYLPQQAAQNEVMRDKSVYGQASSAGDTAGATAAHNWADQVRGVAGIPNTDPTYGNVPTPPQSNQGSQQNVGGPVSAQAAPTAAPSMPPPSNVPSPPANNIYTPMTQDQLKADAQARVDKQLAGLRQAVDYAKTGLKSNFDYTNQITNDRRVLENNAFGRQNNPFNGRTGYLAENMLRDRGIQDKAANDNYNNAVAAQDQKVSDFQAMAPEQQQALYDQLLSAERNFGLQEGTLTGQFNGSPTLAAQGQAAQYTGMYNGAPTIQKQAQDAQYTGTYGGQPTLQAQGQAFNQNLQTNQFNAQQQNQGFNQNMQTQQFAYNQARDSIKDQQYQQQFDRDTQQFGLDYALKQATLNNQITNDQAQRAISQQNADTSTKNANTSAANIKDTKQTNEIASEVYGHAQEFQSAQDVNDYFKANGPYLADHLGAKATDDLKNQFLAPFQQQGKQDTSTFDRALAAAQRDPRWQVPNADRNAIIAEYQKLVTPQ